MRAEDLRDFLRLRQVRVEEDRIQRATRFRGPDGEIFCVYDTGKFVLQGNGKSALASAVEEWANKGLAASGAAGGITFSAVAQRYSRIVKELVEDTTRIKE